MSGGCVASNWKKGIASPLPKNMWLASSAFGVRSREPYWNPPISRAPGNAVGIAGELHGGGIRKKLALPRHRALISLPKKTPM